LAALHAEGIHAVTIVDPGVKKELGAGYRVADEGKACGHFVRDPDGALFTGWVWPGESLFPDFCRAATRRWWGDLHRDLLDIGVDGIWCDMNEPAISNGPLEASDGRQRSIPLAAPTGEATHAETHNLYGLLMSRATSEGLARLRPGRRPWVLTRSAFTGVQRWAATWTGDNVSTWEHLAMSLPQIATMGLCGAPYAGADIGGFYGDCTGELFARWIELGAFYPFMRSHAHHASPPQEPWAFGPEIEAASRAAIGLRYRLLPYLYTLAHRAHRTGEPLLRPLLYDFPDTTALHRVDDQAMLGPQLMVAPVLEPGARRRAVVLPPGTWYDFHTGARVEGGPIDVDAPLGRTPIFVRGGAILTLGNVRESTAQPVTELLVDACPASGVTGHWTLIEDDGETFGFRDGVLAETAYAVTQRAGRAILTIRPRVGPYRPPPRSLVVRLHLPRAPARVLVDDRQSADWRWNSDLTAIELHLADDGRAHRIDAIRQA
jgi:alpha-glucosidase